MRKPRILFYDIETAGVNALKSDLGFVICIGYKWLDRKQAHVLTIGQPSLQHFDDRTLLGEFSSILEEADICVTHYGSVFDKKFLQGRFLINNLPPIVHPPMRDTCMGLRAVTNFSSKRLKHAAKILKFRHQKLENNWPIMWFEVMRGNMKSLRALAVYCKGDVLALEELYLRLRPYVKAWKDKE